MSDFDKRRSFPVTTYLFHLHADDVEGKDRLLLLPRPSAGSSKQEVVAPSSLL